MVRVVVAQLAINCGGAGKAGFFTVSGVPFDGKRVFRRGMIAVVSACLAVCSSGEDGAASMNEASLAETVSRAGTWVKRIGFVDSASTAGRESFVCGWAVQGV